MMFGGRKEEERMETVRGRKGRKSKGKREGGKRASAMPRLTRSLRAETAEDLAWLTSTDGLNVCE